MIRTEESWTAGPRLHESESGRRGQEMEDWEACSTLWVSVIEKAIRDLEWLREHPDSESLRRHERSLKQQIDEFPPDEFFNGPVFLQICDQLNLSPDVVRAEFDVDELIAATRDDGLEAAA